MTGKSAEKMSTTKLNHYDRYWSLFLGRPTSLKSADMAPSCLVKDFPHLLSCRDAVHEKTIETQIYEKLLQLMDIAEALCETRIFDKGTGRSDAYFKIAATGSQLKSWHEALPPDLKWTSANIASAPATFFLLQ